MGEKLPYYCRVKKILAAVKNGPKLARPVVKSALEKLAGLCLKMPFSNNANGLRPSSAVISASRDIDCQPVTVSLGFTLPARTEGSNSQKKTLLSHKLRTLHNQVVTT